MRERLEVILCVEEIVGQSDPLTEWQIKNLHRHILQGIDDPYAGQYRDQQVFIPGNGRSSGLLLNLGLMKVGFPPIIIKTENRLAYYNALEEAYTKED